MQMNFETETHGEKLVVKLMENRLDAALAVRFKDGLKTLVDDGVDYLILDLHQVSFMDSSGLGALVGHMKYMGTERNFELCGLSPTVEKVFKLTRMDSVFTIHDNLAAAVGAGQKMVG
jgi:anti-sigma B factor antagonist